MVPSAYCPPGPLEAFTCFAKCRASLEGPWGGRSRLHFAQDPPCSEHELEQALWKAGLLMVKLGDQLVFAGD